MPAEVQMLMPKFGMGMVEGLIVEWLKNEGDRVQKGESILVIETDKITVEVEAPWSGVLLKIAAPERKEVPCGDSVGVILADEETMQTQVALSGKPRKGKPAAKPLQGDNVSQPARQSPAATASASTAGPGAPPNIDISPIALKIATERGLNIARIKGTGPGGRITKEDVLLAAEQTIDADETQDELEAFEVIPIRGIRKTISERMHASRQAAAHFTLAMEIDMTEAVRMREQLLSDNQEAGPGRPTLNDMIVMATARALADHPRLNCSRVGDEIRVWKQINVGVAVATDRGLVVPVVHDANKKALAEISATARDLAERAREGNLDLSDVSQGTFTVTNLGGFGIDIFTPIINPPEAAILGVGRVAERPVVANGQIVVRSTMNISLSIDHRIIDGAPAAQFMTSIKAFLEEPEWMRQGMHKVQRG